MKIKLVKIKDIVQRLLLLKMKIANYLCQFGNDTTWLELEKVSIGACLT